MEEWAIFYEYGVWAVMRCNQYGSSRESTWPTMEEAIGA